jgi:hypothetical protein
MVAQQKVGSVRSLIVPFDMFLLKLSIFGKPKLPVDKGKRDSCLEECISLNWLINS